MDPNFKYYCPHNFKGKLVLSVELEELDLFSIGLVTVDVVSSNYVFTFPINYVNNAA
jgi:hypothetical protein